MSSPAAEADTHASLRDSRQILVVGGSQGSQRLNELLRLALQKRPLPAGWSVLHQTGTQDSAAHAFAATRADLTTTPFVDNLTEEMALAESGAAEVVVETAASAADELSAHIHRLTGDVAVRERMGQAAATLYRPHAADVIARRLMELADQSDRYR